jgi:rhodanese-related sulfurtransferase
MLPIHEKSLQAEKQEEEAATSQPVAASEGPLVVDVRTPGEFRGGAYPDAINIQLDELASRVAELGSKDRDITLYCASGARSAYAQRMLAQMGFTNVKNGGGLMHMMMRK